MGLVRCYEIAKLKFIGETNKHQIHGLSETEISKYEDDHLIIENRFFRSTDTSVNFEICRPKKPDLVLKSMTSKEVEDKPNNETDGKCIE